MKKRVIIIGIVILLAICLGKIVVDSITLYLEAAAVAYIDALFHEKKEISETSFTSEKDFTEVNCWLVDATAKNETKNDLLRYGINVYPTEIIRKGNLISETFLVSLENSEFTEEDHPDIDSRLKSKIFMTLHYYRVPFGEKMKLAGVTAGWKPLSENIIKIKGQIIYTEIASDRSFVGVENTDAPVDNQKENSLVAKTGFMHYGERIDSSLNLNFAVTKEDKLSNERGDNGTGLSLNFDIAKVSKTYAEKLKDENGNIVLTQY